MRRSSNRKIVDDPVVEITATDALVIPELMTSSDDLLEDSENAIATEIDDVDYRLNELGVDEYAMSEPQSDLDLEWSQELEEILAEGADIDQWEEAAVAELLSDLVEESSRQPESAADQPVLSLAIAKALNATDTAKFFEAVLSAIDLTIVGSDAKVVLYSRRLRY